MMQKSTSWGELVATMTKRMRHPSLQAQDNLLRYGASIAHNPTVSWVFLCRYLCPFSSHTA
jgi:hypothetical protein